MKDSWKSMKLGDVCEFEGGSQPPKSQFIYEEKPGYVRFLQIRDFGSDKNVTFIPQSKKNRLCEENDILIGRYGASVGKILTNKTGAYNVALMKTTPNLGVLNQSWFYNYLISDEFQRPLLNVADRSAQAGFSKDDIFNFPVPVPPLPEQQRIVSILDEAFEGIATAQANAEENLQNARALFESHLQAIFNQRGDGWKTVKLCETADYFIGLTYAPKDVSDRGIIVLRSSNIQNDRLDFSDIVRVNRSIKRDLLVKHGDILMCSRNGSKRLVGKTAIIRNLEEEMTFGTFMTIIRSARNPYLYWFFKSDKFREQIGGGQNPSINQITKYMLDDISVPLPPLIHQEKLVQHIDSLNAETQRLESIYQSKLAALEGLKKSLLHQAFAGNL